MSSSPRPRFFDVIRVTGASAPPEIGGELGYIAGMAEEDGKLFLSAWIYARNEVWSVKTEHLTFLGYQDEIAAEESKRRPSVRVVVDPITGEGKLV